MALEGCSQIYIKRDSLPLIFSFGDYLLSAVGLTEIIAKFRSNQTLSSSKIRSKEDNYISRD